MLVVFFATAVMSAGADAGKEPELALLYDFQGIEGAEVPDGSGHGLTGTLEAGEIVSGRTRPAVRFEGKGLVALAHVAPELDFASRALTVGAMCRPSDPDGVVFSMGDASDGLSLYLQAGVPHFAVRARGVLHEVVAEEPVSLDQWTHLAGVIDAKGELSLLVNTTAVARSQGRLLARTPAAPLLVGADTGSAVGNYRSPLNWQGLVQDVRLYWGAVSREQNRDLLAEWAVRPGCGCRK